MHFHTTALAAVIGLAAASQSAASVPTGTSSSSSSAKCAAQSILDACLSSLKPQLDDCPPNNWKCLCEQSTNVLTCYNNCPDHADRFGVSQQTDSYCRAYRANSALYSSSSATRTSAPSTTTATGPATTADSATASATASGGAGRLEGVVGAGSVMGVALAVLL
ncbi:hypothetical protein HFD88_003265 [Aspergillus terreus]|nr:hypothetical protein HFD88_003265 [Aspergillus terreus]